MFICIFCIIFLTYITFCQKASLTFPIRRFPACSPKKINVSFHPIFCILFRMSWSRIALKLPISEQFQRFFIPLSTNQLEFLMALVLRKNMSTCTLKLLIKTCQQIICSTMLTASNKLSGFINFLINCSFVMKVACGCSTVY